MARWLLSLLLAALLTAPGRALAPVTPFCEASLTRPKVLGCTECMAAAAQCYGCSARLSAIWKESKLTEVSCKRQGRAARAPQLSSSTAARRLPPPPPLVPVPLHPPASVRLSQPNNALRPPCCLQCRPLSSGAACQGVLFPVAGKPTPEKDDKCTWCETTTAAMPFTKNRCVRCIRGHAVSKSGKVRAQGAGADGLGAPLHQPFPWDLAM